MELLQETIRFILNVLLFVGVGICVYLSFTSEESSKRKRNVNGIILGEMFELICEIDDETRLYLDTQTKIMYLMCDSGITPVLDSKGKPRKYVEFLESIQGKED